MNNFYHKILKKMTLIVKFFLFILFGGIFGFMIGLMITTFIPLCCDSNDNCHNCFEFNGLTGYEATGFIGFWFGLILFPVIYLYFFKKNKNNIK